MPATHAKKAQGEESRQRLLEAAADLLGEGGYSSTSVDAIAKRAGVVKSALYWHFSNKRGLLLAALVQFTDKWVEDTQAFIDSIPHPPQRLDKLLDRIKHLIANEPTMHRMLFSLLLEQGHIDDEIRAMIHDVFDRLRDSLNKGFTEVVPVPVERLKIITDCFICMTDGIFLRYMADKDDERLEASIAEARRMILLRITHELQRK